jgi:hypothetical protein
MECNGSISRARNGSMTLFGWDKKEEWNVSLFCLVEAKNVKWNG